MIIRILIAFTLLLSANLFAKTKVMVIHSYSPTYDWTKNIDRGIVKAVGDNKSIDLQLKRLYLHGKKKFREHEIKLTIKNALKSIKEYRPNAVILSDDLAFKNLYPYLVENNIPFSFSGVNNKLENYKFPSSYKGVTGSLERYDMVAATKLLKKLRSSIEKIVIISEKNITGIALSDDFYGQLSNSKIIKSLGIKSIDSYLGTNYEELKKKLKSINPNTTGVIFASFYSYRDKTGRHISYKEVDEWVLNNTNFTDIGIAYFHVKGGRLMSIGSSGEESGYYSAKNLFQSIVKNKAPNTFGIRKTLPLKIMFNDKRAKLLNITIPYELMSFAGSTNILDKSKDKK